MNISRRQWLGLAAAALAEDAAAKSPSGIRFGVCDWNLRLAGKPEALALAKQIGFEGVEVSIGRPPEAGGKLPLDDDVLQARYLEAARQTGIRISSLCLNVLHINGLKNDPLGRKWVAAAIPIAQKLEAETILLPMFGQNEPRGAAELARMGDTLKEFAPAAEKAGVILALENMLPAEDNIRILERANSRAVGVFYDVMNTPGRGKDAAQQLRALGRKHATQVHFKDRGYLGEGVVDFPGVFKALAEIGYKGWIDFETSSPSKSVDADMGRNLAYIRSLLA